MMFDTGEIQEIEDILIHKEQRANLQSNLLSKYSNSSLMVFTLNIPGPIKNNPMIEQVFRQGQQSIQQMFLKKKVEMPLRVLCDTGAIRRLRTCSCPCHRPSS